jgi:hypothetical protein
MFSLSIRTLHRRIFPVSICLIFLGISPLLFADEPGLTLEQIKQKIEQLDSKLLKLNQEETPKVGEQPFPVTPVKVDRAHASALTAVENAPKVPEMPLVANDSSSNGIAIGNHILLNGWLHARFHSVDHETLSVKWFKAITDYFSQENYFWIGADLDSNIKLGNLDLVTHFQIREYGVGIEEFFGEFNFSGSSRLKVGKIVSQRGYHSNDISERMIRTFDYHYMEEGFGDSYNLLLNSNIYSILFGKYSRLLTPVTGKETNDGFPEEEILDLFGVTDEEKEDLSDPAKFDEAFEQLLTRISESILEWIKATSIIRRNYRTSFTKGLQMEVDIDNIFLRVAFRDSIWSTIPSFDEGQFGIDLGAVLYLNSSLSMGGSYAFEKIPSPKGMMTKFIPGATDNIHQLNTYIEFKNDSLTTVLEFDYYMINPLDSQIWDAMLLTQYRFNNGFGLAFRYTYEDISTSLGDGFSHSWTISPSYVINDYALIRTELRTDNAVLGTIPDDYNYMFALETLIDF